MARFVIVVLILCAATVSARAKSMPRSPSESVIRAAIVKALDIPNQPSTDAKTVNYVSRRADLNNDGHAELLVWVPTIAYGGTSGYPLLIFRVEGRRLKLLATIEQVWTPLIIQRSSRHGWHDVVMKMGGGGDPMQYVVFHHDGERYSDRFDVITAKRVKGRRLIEQNWQMSVVGPMPIQNR